MYQKYKHDDNVVDGIDSERVSSGFLPMSKLDAFVDTSFEWDLDVMGVQLAMCLASGPVSQWSGFQSSVALSRMEAEHMAASAATVMNRLWQHLWFGTDRTNTTFEVNKSDNNSDHPDDHQ